MPFYCGSTINPKGSINNFVLECIKILDDDSEAERKVKCDLITTLKITLNCHSLTSKETLYERVSKDGHGIVNKILKNVGLKFDRTKKRVPGMSCDVRKMVVSCPVDEITILLVMKSHEQTLV